MCFVCVAAARETGEHEGHIDYRTDDNNSGGWTSSMAFSSGQYTSAVLSGYSWADSAGQAATVTYTFDTSDIDTSIVYANTYREFTSAEQAITLDVFDKIGAIANLSFVEATNAADAGITFYVGDITYASVAGIAGYYAWDDGTFSHTTVGIDTEYSNIESEGTYDYTTLLHEIGHVIGLKHTGNYGGGDSGDVLPDSIDNTDYSVMSYNDGDGDFFTNPTNYQSVDIEGLQYLYGTSDDYDITDYVSSDSDSGSDTGADTNDFVGSSSNTTDDELYGGLGADTIYGGGGADTIYGGRAIADADDSADTIYGHAGGDEIYGNTGGDLIYGGDNGSSTGDGADTVYGGLGEDTIYGNSGNDSLAGGGGIAHPQDDADTIYGGDGNDSILGNGGDDFLYGGAGNDTFWGGLDNDNIFGQDGDDFIVGQNGTVYMEGGNGADTFYFYTTSTADYSAIGDFSVSEDVIRLTANINGSGITSAADALALVEYSGLSATIYFADTGDSIVLNNFSDTLTTANFEIV